MALIAKKLGRLLAESKNYQKQRIVVASLHEKVANQRNDFLHKLSIELIKNHDLICLETLIVKGLVKNRKLAKFIHDALWSLFITKYATKRNGMANKSFRLIHGFLPAKFVVTVGIEMAKKRSLFVNGLVRTVTRTMTETSMPVKIF